MARPIDADALKEEIWVRPIAVKDMQKSIVLTLIDEAPTIEPNKGEWIPCSERLPDEDGEYLVTQKNGSIGRYVFNCDGNSEEYFKRCAIAWMPLPEPWERSK